ncbi:MAG: hypothetical protein HW407_1848, partial [Bacteroidetes bacterium]|nr:hypothetical protein [Bacteroidota bacterium]
AETSSFERLAQPAEFVLDKPVIEPRIVRDEDGAIEKAEELPRNIIEERSVGSVIVRDAGELLDGIRDEPLRIDEGLELPLDLAFLNANHRNLDNPAVDRAGAGGLHIDDGEGLIYKLQGSIKIIVDENTDNGGKKQGGVILAGRSSNCSSGLRMSQVCFTLFPVNNGES